MIIGTYTQVSNHSIVDRENRLPWYTSKHLKFAEKLFLYLLRRRRLRKNWRIQELPPMRIDFLSSIFGPCQVGILRKYLEFKHQY